MYKVHFKKTSSYLLSTFIYFFWDYDLDKISVDRQVTSSKHIANLCLLIKYTFLTDCLEEIIYFPILTLSTEFPFQVSGLSAAAVKPEYNVHNIFGNRKKY